MMRASGLIVLALSLLASGQAYGQEGITRDQALTIAPTDLFTELAGQAARLFPEVERPTYVGLSGHRGPMSHIRFASLPRAIGPGMCGASVISFMMEPISLAVDDGGFIAGPEQVAGLSLETVYKIVGELTDGEWTDDQRASAQEACEAAGRVVAEGSADLAHRGYFSVRGSPFHAVAALQRTIADAKGGKADVAVCSSKPQRVPCSNPDAILRGLETDALVWLSLDSCENAQSSASGCVTARFARTEYDRQVDYWDINFPIEVSDGGPAAKPHRVGPAEVHAFTVAFD